MLNPGDKPFAPANLSAAKELVLSARGNGRITVMLFTTRGGRTPSSKTLKLDPKWKEYRLGFSDFGGSDGGDVTGIAFVAGPQPGRYEFELYDIALR